MRNLPVVLKVALTSLTACLLSAGSCLTGTTTGETDAGPTEQLCSADPDCPEFFQCTGGVCRRPCGNDDVCDFGEFCNSTGFCQRGCRDTASCNSADLLCVEGVCTDRSQVGTCATKADCTTPPDTKVCVDGQCVDPPTTCAGPQDCPGAGQCNGFTHTCFDPNGECQVDNDCSGRATCSGGCTCSADKRCVATPSCTLGTEATACGTGSYCDVSTMRCKPSPTCVKQADCNAAGLACNTSTRVCERGAPCTANSACTTGRFTQCNTTAGYCQEPSCINGGITCTGGQMCQTDGTCGTGSGTACTMHEQCPLGPPVQYCDAFTQTCKTGCRNDSNCNASIGEKCNGQHVCAVPSGSSSSGGTGGGDGEACTDDADCRAGYSCAPLTSVCREACVGTCCPQTGYGCAFAWCSPAVQPDAACMP